MSIIGKGNYQKNKVTDFFQQLSLNWIQLCQWIVGDGPQIMCEEHGGGDTTSSQQPGDVTVHTETECHHNDSRVKLRKCLRKSNQINGNNLGKVPRYDLNQLSVLIKRSSLMSLISFSWFL